MKTTKIGCLFVTIIPHSFFFYLCSYRLKALFVGLLLLASSVPLCLAGEHFARTKTLSFVAGSAKDKFSSGAPANTQNTSGLIFDIGSSGEPLRFALDSFSGEYKKTVVVSGGLAEVILRVSETALGARYYLEDISPGVDFYAGGGLALVSANIEVIRFSNVLSSGIFNFLGSDSGTYFGFGIRRIFDDGFTLGFDYRDSDAEFELEGHGFVISEENYGFTRTSLTLGYNW